MTPYDKFFTNQLLYHVVVTSADNSLISHRVFSDKKRSYDYFIECNVLPNNCFVYTTRFSYDNDNKSFEIDLTFDYD